MQAGIRINYKITLKQTERYFTFPIFEEGSFIFLEKKKYVTPPEL